MYERSRPLVDVTEACSFVRHIQHSRQVFLLLLSPLLCSLLLSSLAGFVP